MMTPNVDLDGELTLGEESSAEDLGYILDEAMEAARQPEKSHSPIVEFNCGEVASSSQGAFIPQNCIVPSGRDGVGMEQEHAGVEGYELLLQPLHGLRQRLNSPNIRKARRRGVLPGIWPDIYNEEKERTLRQQRLQLKHNASCCQSERPSVLVNSPRGRVAKRKSRTCGDIFNRTRVRHSRLQTERSPPTQCVSSTPRLSSSSTPMNRPHTMMLPGHSQIALQQNAFSQITTKHIVVIKKAQNGRTL